MKRTKNPTKKLYLVREEREGANKLTDHEFRRQGTYYITTGLWLRQSRYYTDTYHACSSTTLKAACAAMIHELFPDLPVIPPGHYVEFNVELR